MASDKRQHWHSEPGDAWRPERGTQRAHGFQPLSQRYTYSDTNGYAYFHSFADRKPDSKSDSNSKGQANAEAPSHWLSLNAS